MIQCFIKRDIQISRRFRQGQPHFRTGERVHPKRPFQMRLPGPYRDVGIEGNPLRATTTEGRAWHDRRQFAGEAVLQMAAAVNLQPNRTHRRIEPHARILQAELYVRQIEWRGGFGIAKLVDFTERSEEHTSELQSLMRISYAVFCLKKQNYTLF